MPPYDIFFFGALFFLFGVLFASLQLKFWILVIATVLFIGFMVLGLLRKENKFLYLGFLVLTMLIGSLYYTYDDLHFKKNTNLVFGEKLEFSGVVVTNPVIKNNFQEFSVETQEPVNGKVLVNTERYPAVAYGYLLKIKGVIKKPQSSGYARYLEKERISGTVSFPEIEITSNSGGNPIKRALFRVRNAVAGSFKKVLGAKEAAFLTGLTLGGTSELPKEFKEAMSKSGTTHLVALSGYNISVIIWAVMSIFLYFLKRRTAFILSTAIILGFVLMTGGEASVVRAAIMAFLVLLAYEVGRAFDFRNAIAFSGLIMVLENPKVLVFDIGFQLSFLALLGIIYLRPAFKKILKMRDSGFLSWKDNLLTTFSAQLMVAPVLISNFGQVSLTSLIANVLILELIPITMGLGFAIAGSFFIFAPIAIVLGWLATLFLKFEIATIEIFSKVSISFSLVLSLVMVLVYYALVSSFIIYARKIEEKI